jgi:hypothetical protein
LTACGGSDGGEERSLSAPEFRQQASAICEKSGSQIAALRQPDGINSLRYFLDQSVPIIEEANSGFHDLSPPDELAEDWDEFTDTADENLEVTRNLRDALDENDGSRAQTLFNELGSLNNDIVRGARTLGLEACVGPPPSP